jgi:drug/metabolite transporter (DMT)-like permease
MSRAGYAAVSLAAVLWAVGGAYASRLIDQGASFVELTEARAWITAIVLLAVASRRPRTLSAQGDPPPWWSVTVFGLSIAAANLTYYASLSLLPVAVAITIQYTAPGLVVVWAVVVQRQRLSRRLVASLAGALVGVALLSLPGALASGRLRLDPWGLLIAGLSAFAFATYMISGEFVGRSLGALQTVLRGFLVSSVVWIVTQIVRGRPDTLLDLRFLPAILFLAVATTIAPFLLFVWGLERIRASDAGIVSTLEPLTAAIIAYVWLGQTLSPWQLVGGALVISGIAIVQAERPERREVLAERAAVE